MVAKIPTLTLLYIVLERNKFDLIWFEETSLKISNKIGFLLYVIIVDYSLCDQLSQTQDTLRDDCDPGDDCIRNCCVSALVAPVFFVVFVLMAQFVLVNVVVAVLMKHLEVGNTKDSRPTRSLLRVLVCFLFCYLVIRNTDLLSLLLVHLPGTHCLWPGR